MLPSLTDSNREGLENTVFRDVFIISLIGLLFIIVILLQHFNPPTKEDDAPPPGNIIIEATWDGILNTDVDLWVAAPKGKAVGYSNLGNPYLNLLRDDLGTINDLSNINHEITYSRGIIPGEYIVNLHYYRPDSRRPEPVTVHVIVSMKKDNNSRAIALFSKHITLTFVGEEATVIRFTIDENKNIIPDSVTDRPIIIRKQGVFQR
tara:strand:- start:1022 stop:1639 length:618 start_codon:yes stop_codon:yes gene_type:complete